MINIFYSYATRNTNLTTTSAILGSIIIAASSIFFCWCMCKVCERKSERIFPCVSNMDLRGIGNRDVGIQIEDDQPTPGPSRQSGETETSQKGQEKKEKSKKKDEKKESKKTNKEKDVKKQDEDKQNKIEKEEKKWWERPVSLSDILNRQGATEKVGEQHEQKKEKGKKKTSESKEQDKEEEKGEPEKTKDQLPDGSFYSPFEDDD